MSNLLTFKISIPTTDSFIGRECNNPDCKKYFKIHTGYFKDELFCPYCGIQFPKDQLWTPEQLDFAKQNAIEEGTAYITNEFDKMLKDVFRSSGSSKSGFSMSYKSNGPYRKKIISPPSERNTDTELECSSCGSKFQVIGLFGFCPCCREDNIVIYDTNIRILLDDINSSKSPDRFLRHAYNDLVSTFEEYCKRKNKTERKFNFQNLDVTEKFFRDHYHKELFSDITQPEVEVIKRFFQKRHVYQHNKGIIDQRYVEVIPSDVSLLGKTASLTVDEFMHATSILRNMIINII